MKLEADIRIVLRVPFEAAVDELPEPEVGLVKLRDGTPERIAIVAPKTHEEKAAAVDAQRAQAGRHAESEIVDLVRAALAGHGEVVAAVVEEVRER